MGNIFNVENNSVNSPAVIALSLFWKAQYPEDLLYPGSRSKLTCFTARLCLDQGFALVWVTDKFKCRPLLNACYRMRHEVLVTTYTCNNEIQFLVFRLWSQLRSSDGRDTTYNFCRPLQFIPGEIRCNNPYLPTRHLSSILFRRET